MAQNNFKYVQGISFANRWQDIKSENLSLSGAFRAFRGLLSTEKENSAKRLLSFIPAKLEKKEWKNFETYMSNKYPSGAPKKQYSMYYIFLFFDRLAKNYFLEYVEKDNLTDDQKNRLNAARAYLIASRKETQDKKQSNQ